jgi:uncharacterized protein
LKGQITMSNTPGQNAVNWFEIPVTNLDKATALYSAMLDIELKREVFMGVPHAIFATADRSGVAGALISDPKRAPKRGTGTTVYLNAIDGVERCVSRAREAGAKVILPATSIGEMGTIALIEDLDGNVVGLHAEPRS